MRKPIALALAAAGLATVAAAPEAHALRCHDDDPLRLQILHSSDNESSFRDPNTLEPKILNYAALARGLRKLARNEDMASIHVTVGDHTIPGPFYQAAAEVPEFGAPGIADILMYNAMKLKANGMGNHEFDGTIDEFASMLAAARYPFVAVNLDFSNVVTDPSVPEILIGRDRTNARRNRGKVVRSTVLRVQGQCIGLIGRAPADFFNVIEDPDNTLGGLDFVGGRDANNQPLVSAVTQVLEEVEALEAKGINKIFLLDHAQDFTGDPLSASALRGIDVIIAAGTTGFMAKPAAEGPFNLLREGDSAQADYPTVREDSLGNEILVINSDQQYRYVGNLMVEFDETGTIVAVDGRSGPVATTQEAVDLLAGELSRDRDGDKDSDKDGDKDKDADRAQAKPVKLQAPRQVREVFARLEQTALIQGLFNEIATTTAPLNGNRADVRSRETNLGRLAADSTLVFTRQEFPGLNVDVALKNGGGIRDSILGPSVIRLTIQAALAFDNKLTVIELTGAQLLAVMENSVSRVPALDGRFPQIAGMVLEFDANFPGLQGQTSVSVPSRVRNLTVTKAGGQVVNLVSNGAANPAALADTYVMATNSFLATGGDGYAALAAGTALATTAIGEQLILEAYIVDSLGGTVNLPEPLANARVVRLNP